MNNLGYSLSALSSALSSPTPSDGVSVGSASSDSAHPITSHSSISSGDSDSQAPDKRIVRVCLLISSQQSTVNYKSMIVSTVTFVYGGLYIFFVLLILMREGEIMK